MTSEERIEKLEERIKILERLAEELSDLLANHGYGEDEEKE